MLGCIWKIKTEMGVSLNCCACFFCAILICQVLEMVDAQDAEGDITPVGGKECLNRFVSVVLCVSLHEACYMIDSNVDGTFMSTSQEANH